MNQAELLKYLTEVDKELRPYISQVIKKCPYTLCETRKLDSYWDKLKQTQTCDTSKDFLSRWVVCDKYQKLTIERIAKNVGIKENLVPVLIRTILSFEGIPCSFRNECNFYKKDSEVCEFSTKEIPKKTHKRNEEEVIKVKVYLGLIERISKCEPYKTRMLKEIEDYLDHL